ncbi:hydrogenase maturation protease [Desulfobulbus propionicus DSM 2032]|uniref:Hydrogenase maturation protease n=2 Tax=Desulfobulbus propionicus TaxID=894 RepID=A0A7U4DPB8_DESPD|nr:hydrogenase maturation protease [Desulfobulbus propionicus DSM 2032]
MAWCHIMHISHKTHIVSEGPEVAIFGCGNLLMGDDGFGPTVIARLRQLDLPPSVRLFDVGTSIREQLLDYLMLPLARPKVLIVVDAEFVSGQPPGQVRHCTPRELERRKVADFSLHQFPTVNLLAELEEESGIEVLLLLAQAASLPDHVAPGLSPPMQAAVDTACARLLDLVGLHTACRHHSPATVLEAAAS